MVVYVGEGANNYASFENCTFLRNTASEFAAAISLSTLDPFRQVDNSNPSRIIDWLVDV